MTNLSLARVPVALATTAFKVYPYPGAERAKDKIKYLFRGLLTPKLTQQWFQFLSRPELAVVTEQNPRIFGKLQRPYLHLKLRPAMRLKALTQHYGFVA